MSVQDPPQDVTPAQCANQLLETLPTVMQCIRAEMRRQSASLLSVPQFRELAFLNRCPGSSLSEVAEHLGVTRATASAMTERLVQRDLVHRAEDPHERRQVVLTLTAKGSSQFLTYRENTRDYLAELLSDLPTEQLSSLCEGLLTLKQRFESESVESAVAKSALG